MGFSRSIRINRGVFGWGSHGNLTRILKSRQISLPLWLVELKYFYQLKVNSFLLFHEVCQFCADFGSFFSHGLGMVRSIPWIRPSVRDGAVTTARSVAVLVIAVWDILSYLL